MKGFALIGTLALSVAMALGQSYGARAFIANYDENTVSVIDDESRDIVATVTTGEKPAGIAIAPNGTAVYVANEAAKTLSILDPATNTVSGTVTLSGMPKSVVISSDGATAFVAISDQNAVEVIDLNGKSSVAKISVGRSPSLLALSLDGNELYVGCESDSAITVVDTQKREQTATIKLYSSPISMVMLGNGKLAVTLRWLNGFALIDPKDRKVGAGWTRPEFLLPGDKVKKVFPEDGMFASGLGGYQSGGVALWVNPVNGLVYDVDTAKEFYIVGFAPTGAGANSVGVSPDGKTAYVTNSTDGTVSVLDIVLHIPMKKLTVGKNPRALAVGRVKTSK